ncbi:uncharacterized protein LOC108628530 isoform X2 [Ceratina calcarata]|uniref:Uncharacterized protein LOC108628530 isoform X2 n=1 Tax=Ceratina calcarata TaxID=156304 RepID=A0AAJ7S851_9HYME|nr:uncharacterized protein LOC108628530 isoform X2 [Ceratina calcarata]
MTFGTPFHTEKAYFPSDNPIRPDTMAAEEGALSGGLGAKLKCPTPISRLRVEKIEGGLMVAGVVIAANCQIALPAFGFLFMLVGAVLTGTYIPFCSYSSFSPIFRLSAMLRETVACSVCLVFDVANHTGYHRVSIDRVGKPGR